MRAKSGISRADQFADHGFRRQVAGIPNIESSKAWIDRRAMRLEGQGGRLELFRDGAGDPRQRR